MGIEEAPRTRWSRLCAMNQVRAHAVSPSSQKLDVPAGPLSASPALPDSPPYRPSHPLPTGPQAALHIRSPDKSFRVRKFLENFSFVSLISMSLKHFQPDGKKKHTRITDQETLFPKCRFSLTFIP